ncbi:MAG: hypothetical protein R3Y28_04460 [Candidatus Gastranaerophilales bacterium]
MIKSEVIKIQKPDKIDNEFIENQLARLGITPIRWAIVEVKTNELVIGVSFHSYT